MMSSLAFNPPRFFQPGCFKDESKYPRAWRFSVRCSVASSLGNLQCYALKTPNSQKTVRIGCFTGAETVRLLANHPRFGITLVTADKKDGQSIASVFPGFLRLGLPDMVAVKDADFSTVDAVVSRLWRIPCVTKDSRDKESQEPVPEEVTIGNNRVHNRREQREKKWKKPMINYFKLNFAGSKRYHHAACGYIIRDAEGRVVCIGKENCGSKSIILTEACGLHLGVQKAIDLGIMWLYIEGDNKVVINAINDVCMAPWDTKIVVSDVQFNLHKLKHYKLFYSPKATNRAAKFVADVRRSFDCDSIVCNPHFKEIIRKDALDFE